MDDWQERTKLLIGEDGAARLKDSHVAVFGVGGVGGYCVEALARAGIGGLTLIDGDVFSLSNLNRQILATRDSVGISKVEVAFKRIKSINPLCEVNIANTFFLPNTDGAFDFASFDYVADAIDTISGKLEIVRRAKEAGTPVISCMGAGNKLDATSFKVTDIYETSVCPLAKVMRRELKKLDIPSLKVVYSTEPPLKRQTEGERKMTTGSISYVPAVAGLILAGEIIKDLIAFLPQKSN